jgi:acetoin utilization deacetylase AcuC-like enzyme
MSVGYICDPVYLKHDDPGDHPENSRRLVAIMDLLQSSKLLDKSVPLTPRDATHEELARVHSEEHIELIQRVSESRVAWLGGDTYACPDSYRAALRAAGGVIRGVDAVLDGEVTYAYALVRPPGHHATRDQPMGFCLFNNVAVAAYHALERRGLKRVLIADFDVHHGNGTQDTFYSDQRVCYFSTHQYPHYPGTGASNECGLGQALGTTVNFPMSPYAGDAEYLDVYKNKFVPAAKQFRPELILVSAGYDAHWADQLSAMQMTVEGYAQIARMLKETADELCQGRLVFALEGGYNLQALSHCVRATFEVLLGLPVTPDPLGEPHGKLRYY